MQMTQHAELIPAESSHLIDLDAGRPVRWGVWLVIAGFGGFLLWSCLAPLDSRRGRHRYGQGHQQPKGSPAPERWHR